MTNDIKEINGFGRELENLLKQENLEPSQRTLITKAIKFGYLVGRCETKYDLGGEPYNSYNCIEKYEQIQKRLREKD